MPEEPKQADPVQMTIRIPLDLWKTLKHLQADGDVPDFQNYVMGLIKRNLKIRKKAGRGRDNK